MLDLDKYIEDEAYIISLLYREIETDILVEIAKSIQEVGYIASTSEYKLQRLQAITGLDRDIISRIAQISGKPLKEIEQMINNIGIKTIDIDLYRTAYERSLVLHDIDKYDLDDIIKSMQDETSGIIKGIHTKALENTLQEYRNTVNKAVLMVNTGLYSESEAIVRSVTELGKVGITSATYKRKNSDGTETIYKTSLEPTISKVVRTEFIKASNHVSHEVGKDMGVTHWYITQHLGARNKGDGHENHQSWQGLVVTTKELSTKAGYGEITGLGGINCRHRHYPHFEGISVKPPPLIDKEENDTVYALTQKQRLYERRIRESKRIIMMLEQLDGNEDATNEIIYQKRLLKQRQNTIDVFIKRNKKYLKRNYKNERVVNINK